MKYSGKYHMGVHKATLAAAGKQAGDTVAIAIELDHEPLPGDTLPPELATALAKNSRAKTAWDALSPSHRREHVNAINDAKKPATRKSRIERTLAMLLQ